MACQRWTNGDTCRHVRVQVAKACVASRCLHQGGTWDELQGTQLRRLKVAWSRPWRNHRPQDRVGSPMTTCRKELQLAELED